MAGHSKKPIAALFAVLVMLNHEAHAQQGVEVEDIVTTAIASFAFIIIAILALMIYRRVSSRRRESMYDSTGLDLMSLRNKGLLTPEEMEKVSRSIARRLEEKEAARKRAASRPTPEALLLDPEIRRLQALAEATEVDTAGKRKTADHGTTETEISSTPPRAVEPATNNPDTPLSSSDEASSVTVAADEIELPPEVQQLADAGVLTQEELENVKQRLRDRRNSLQ